MFVHFFYYKHIKILAKILFLPFSFLHTAVPRDEVAVHLKGCQFYPSPEPGSFVANISWDKPTFNYSSLTAYQLYYKVAKRKKLENVTVSILVMLVRDVTFYDKFIM